MLAGAASAQPPTGPTYLAPQGAPQDWSNRSVVYAHPDTPEEAARKGRTAKWRHDYQDPRFVVALTRRLQSLYAVNDRPSTPTWSDPFKKHPKPPVQSGMSRDWSHVMGGGADGLGGKGTSGVFPAKYSFNISAAPDCLNDFVVYPTGTAGATDSVGTLETLPVTITGVPTGTITIGTAGTARTIVLTASAGSNTGQNFQTTGGTTAVASNLAAAVNRYANTTGIVATSATNVVTLKHNMSGNTVTIPITNSLTNATTGAAGNGAGTGGQPTLIAFNQLYNGTCTAGQTVAGYPNVYWSYNTGTGASVITSPVISYYDGGKQVAFVQSTAGVASLVLLKWSSASPGTAGAPTAPTAQTLANYRACTAPCMTTIALNGGANDTTSSPYVDYAGDVVWVGDDNGKLHKITGAFAGTPAEVVGGGFPALVGDGDHETWVGTFTGTGPTTSGQTVNVNAQVLTTSTANNTFPNFRVNVGATNGAKQAGDATNLAADANNYSISTGISAVAAGSTVTFTNNASGDVSNTLVAEGAGALDVANFAIVNTQQGTPNNALSSPVYDGNTGMVFVGTDSGVNASATGGQLVKVNASTGAITRSAQIAAINTVGVLGSPILDSSAARVYVTVFADVLASGTCGPGGTGSAFPCHGLFQFDTAFTAGTSGTETRIGHGLTGSPTRTQYAGTFDDAYLTNASPTGAFYICGSDATTTSTVAMWKIPINNNVMGTPVQGTTVASGGGAAEGSCAPVSEVKNGSHDYLFFSIENFANDNGNVCGSGNSTDACVYMLDLSNLGSPSVSEQWTFSFTANQTVAGGTLVVNGVTFTANASTTSCTTAGGTFSIGGNQAADATALRTCLTGNVTGFTVGGAGNNVIITRTAPGNVADNQVAEGVDMNNFSETVASHVQGVGPTDWDANNVPAAGLLIPGGTGGIVIDNISALSGASQVYFSNLSSPGNAYQASQAGLQ